MPHDREQREQRWALASQSAAFGVWDFFPALDQVHYSPEWKAALGYEPTNEPDSTATWRARVHPDDLQPMVDALSAHLAGREPAYEIEFRLRTSDRSFRRVLSRGRVVERDAQGHALRVVGTLTDITERHLADALRAERDAAQASLRAKTEFLSRMSHELRTPLNAVLGFAQLLASGIGEASIETQRRHVAQIEKAGWQLLGLIDGVLELSDVERGRTRLDSGPVELRAMLQGLIDELAPDAHRRCLRIALDASRPTAVVTGDPVRLRQVFAKLLGNAISYNVDGGHICVRIGAASGRCTVTVRDSGAGISADRLPHLFDSFDRRGRGGVSGERMGVGLALARSLVERMGGTIGVESEPGAGTTFSVTLPERAGAPVAASAKAGAGEGNRTPV